MPQHKRDPSGEIASRIIAKATEILDNYGIADLTMRRLARELDVTAGSLYWHFADKQQLLGAVADEVLRPACDTAEATDWQHRITEASQRLRDALLSHTDGAELVSASFAAGQSARMRQILAALADATVDAGVAPENAELAGRTIIYYVLGFTVDEQSRLQWDAAGALEPERSLLDPREALNHTGRAFEFGLSVLIDGLAVRAGNFS
ncbi:TetR/AcrR family transcriptional regulator C-terminal domain-containing protein [Mycolicibacterium komossense]|uniref:TetR/AcrR family transcriptional regulator C-terminal domain-containing protein n=1 Tax=Mycolicibacterium komossense TaxID=1779 RepID=UPI0027E35BA6|nr:TetR/AcrR family transcriptional regulator C-terminal domain-containing protein [Mycolicibacterium komossense]